MRKDHWFGLGVTAGAIILGMIIYRVSYRQEAGIQLEFYILPALLFILGLLICFTDIETYVVGLKETIEELPEAVSDDWEALKSGRITFPIVAAVISMAGIIGESWLIFHFRKWNAQWGPVSVLLVATLVVIGIIAVCYFSGWFQDRWERLHWKLFVIPMIGFIVCALLGVYYAEPTNYRALSPMERDQLAQSDQYTASTRGGDVIYMFSRSAGSSASDVDIDCDGDACGALLLLVVVIVCIAGSALIPHFWVLATMLLLSIMVMIALRELLYYERKRSWKY